MLDEKKAVLILEMGHLQIFCYQTAFEWANHAPYNDVYWQRKDIMTVRGPFLDVWCAAKDYSDMITMDKTTSAIPNNVVFVDFKNKRRLK